MLIFLQRSGLHLPSLQILAEFARPVFLGGGHEDLAAGLARLFEQRQESAAPVHVQFAHHVVNQQNRRRTLEAGQKFRLRHFQRNRQRALLAFAAELRGGFSIEQQLQIVAVRPDQRGAIGPFPVAGLRQFHGEILFHARLVFNAQFLRVVGNAPVRQPRQRGEFRRQLAAGADEFVTELHEFL